MKFEILTRQNMRKLEPGKKLAEHGIHYSKLSNGDGKFSVFFRVDGQFVKRAIGKESEGVTRTNAEEFIEQARTDARHGRLNLPKGRKVALGFIEAAKNYLARVEVTGGKDLKSKTHRTNGHLIPFFGSQPLTQITSWDIERYKKHRLDEGAAKGTINRELAVLSHMLNKAVEWDWIQQKPVHRFNRLKEDNVRIYYLTAKQAEDLLKAAKKDDNDWIYMFILIGLETGMRRSEIQTIEIEHIFLERLMIHLPKAKAGPRDQPITPRLTLYLENHLRDIKKKKGWLFPSHKSKTGHVTNPEKPFVRCLKRAKLNPEIVKRHTLRHTAVTHLVQAGVDLPTVARISGHKTLSMVQRYSHQNGDHIREAMEKLQSRYSENSLERLK